MAKLQHNPADLIEGRAKTLMRQGYRCTSNRHNMLSRIDRPDWKEVLAKDMHWTLEQTNAMIDSRPGAWQDQYRRVYSKDHITVSQAVYRKCVSSGFDPIGYIILERDSK